MAGLSPVTVLFLVNRQTGGIVRYILTQDAPRFCASVPPAVASHAETPTNTRREMAAMVPSLASAIRGLVSRSSRAQWDCGTTAAGAQWPGGGVVGSLPLKSQRHPDTGEQSGVRRLIR